MRAGIMHKYRESPPVRPILDIRLGTISGTARYKFQPPVIPRTFQAFGRELKPMPARFSLWPVAKKERSIAQEGQDGQRKPSYNADPEIVRNHQPTGLWIEDKQVHPVQRLRKLVSW